MLIEAVCSRIWAAVVLCPVLVKVTYLHRQIVVPFALQDTVLVLPTKVQAITVKHFILHFFFPVWAEAGDFRDNTHSAMSAIPSSMDHHSQLSFQASNASRGRSRDRKADGEFKMFLHALLPAKWML